MAYQLKPIDNGLCCQCGQFTGCSCGGQSCGLECEYKSDIAELCGESEFTTPSTPPKKYRRKALAGTVYRGEWEDADCPSAEVSDLDQTSTVSYTYFGAREGTMRVQVVRTETSATLTYTATGMWDNAQVDAAKDGAVASTVFVGNNPATLEVAIAITAGQVLTVGVSGGHPTGGPMPWTPNPLHFGVYEQQPRVTRDIWDASAQYGADDCALDTEDLSIRLADDAPYPLTSGGEGEEWLGFSGSPNAIAAYGAEVEITGETPTERHYTPVTEACQGEGPFTKISGEVVESLSDEDTEEDALTRALAALTWTAAGVEGCAGATAFLAERGDEDFSFAFRSVRVRGVFVGLLPCREYEFTIRYTRRVMGSGGEFLFHALDQVTIETPPTGSDPSPCVGPPTGTLYSDWFDVPNEVGWETRAHVCSLTLIPL